MEPSLSNLFIKWNELNSEVSEFMEKFDFNSIKEIRTKQREIEDQIYSILLKNAPKEIKEIIPDTCDELEIGYDSNNDVFYYVMIDPQTEDNEEIKLIAITIDTNKNVDLIKDFKENE